MSEVIATEPGAGNPVGPRIISPEEDALRRYEARLGFWRFVLGTVVIGLAGILIPAVVNLTTIMLEHQRKDVEFRTAKEQAHQTYIKEFLATGLNQDIELRLRFAHYFKFLSGEEQRKLWESYFDDLKLQREKSRADINRLDAEIARLIDSQAGNVELNLKRRELEWAHSEVGYAALYRSIGTAAPETRDRLKKERLYRETSDIVQRFAAKTTAIGGDTEEYRRFWELYRKDLIGVESRDVARGMVALGSELESIVKEKKAPTDGFKKLASDLRATISRELRGDD